MAATDALSIFRGRVVTTVNNINDLRAKMDDVRETTNDIKDVIGFIDDAGDIAGEIRESIEKQLSVLKVTKNAGPLSTPSKLFEAILKTVLPVAEAIEDAVDTLNLKQDTGTAGEETEGQFLEFLENVLGALSTTLNAASNGLLAQEIQLIQRAETLREFDDAVVRAADMVYDPDPFDGVTPPRITAFDNLDADIDAQISARNVATAGLNAQYNAIITKIDDLFSLISDASVPNIEVDARDLEIIGDVLAFIKKPLEIAAALIKPIEPLLDAVGFIVGLIVDPILDFILEKVGLNDLFDRIGDQITALLPDTDFIDPLIAAGQDLLNDLREFRDNAFGILGVDGFISDVNAAFGFDANVGDASLGPTGIGSLLSETLNGDEFDDILDAQGGDDTINGNGGNDILIAGAGNDAYFGGAGEDMVYFEGNFNEYELAKTSDTGNVIITHVMPQIGKQNEGSTILDGIEWVVFDNIIFTGAELEAATIGGSILNGDQEELGQDDLMFLNSSGTLVDGFYVANGLGGNDRIFGSVGNDRLNGGLGNDILIPGLGNDEVNGDAGSDTYQILSGSNSNNRLNLLTGSYLGPEGNDTLNSIENVILQGAGDHEVTGNNLDNYIITADGDDIVGGLEGDDSFNTGDGDDVIVGGRGRDAMDGGAGNDILVVGGDDNPSGGEVFVGGDGEYDAISYSNNHSFIVNDLWNFDINQRQAIDRALDLMVGAPGPVRMYMETGTIERLDSSGTVIGTDTAQEIERYAGSDSDDVIFGARGFGDVASSAFGAGGDDTIHTGGVDNAFGNDGSDTIIVTADAEGRLSGGIYEGGDGSGDVDLLDLTALGDVRWWFNLQGSSSRSIRAFDTETSGNLGAASGALFFANISGFEEYLLGDGDNFLNLFFGNSIERTYHTGSGEDVFKISGGQAVIYAGDGEDEARYTGDGGSFYGEGGDDFVEFDDTTQGNFGDLGAGDDFAVLSRHKGDLVGGDGYDTVSFDMNSASTRATVNLATGVMDFYGLNGNSVNQVIGTISGVERVIGTNFNDNITGDAEDNELIGRAGSDLINAGDGEDRLFGGSGNDTLFGLNDNDFLHGGLGNDSIDGGDGVDTVSFANAVPDTALGVLTAGNFGAGVNVNLFIGNSSGVFGSDSISNVENLIGSSGNDTLSGDLGDNVISGGRGNDLMFGNNGDDVLVLEDGEDQAYGGDGDDTFAVGAGKATIFGEAGYDTIEFEVALGTMLLDFSQGGYDVAYQVPRAVWADTLTTEARTAGGLTATPSDIQQIDPFHSDDASDLTREIPNGHAETFQITERLTSLVTSNQFQSIEEIIGGVSNTTVVLSNAVDRYDGSRSESDTLDLSAETVSFSFIMGSGFINAAIGAGDVLLGFEHAEAGSGDDSLSGTYVANELYGNDGNDVLFGRNGDDRLFGGEGNDRMYGDGGGDLLIGGEGNDTIYSGDDDEGAEDYSVGNDGDDVFYLGTGYDYVDGGVGIDLVDYASSDDGVRVDLRLSGSQVVSAHQGPDELYEIENLNGSYYDDRLYGDDLQNVLTGRGGADRLFAYGGDDLVNGGNGDDLVTGGTGDDTVYGGAGNDEIQGNIGNDLLIGNAGNDQFLGGQGSDTVSYASATGGVNAYLQFSGSEVGSGEGRDSFDGIENLTGSAFNDRLNGDAGNNMLMGGAGDDILKGIAGDNVIYGGSGADRLFGGAHADDLHGGGGNDTLIALAGDDALYGDSGADLLFGGRDVDALYGGTGGDNLRGNLGNDMLFGEEGSDDLRGGGNNDMMHGGADDDFLFGENGSDTLSGGAGNDAMSGGSGLGIGDGFADTFVYADTASGGGGFDRIKDMEDGLDLIDLTAFGYGDFSAVNAVAANGGADTRIDFGSGDVLYLEGFALANFGAEDVLL